MSETFFPVNDLLRRKLQTGLVITGLALCVASTLFLLLLGDKIGFGVLFMMEDRLTPSFSTVFSKFIIFVGFLIFVVGIVIVSFLVFIMMSQRIRDIGLMKAVGCPSNLVFGYFMNELIIVASAGCLLGIVVGIVADYSSTSLLNTFGFQSTQESVNLGLAVIIFLVFLIVSLTVGAKPVLDAIKVKPSSVLSPSFSLGLKKESDFKGVSKAGLTLKIAVRTLFRRKSTALRIVLCLSAVFILVTVSTAGGLIADQTTKGWIEKAIGRNILLIAHRDICTQYRLLLSKFYEKKVGPQFNYSNQEYLVPQEILSQLEAMANVTIDQRLITEAKIAEVQGIILGNESGSTVYVGDSRKGTSLIVGVEPEEVLSRWFLEGEFLDGGQTLEAVVGDAVAQKMFSKPLYQNLTLLDHEFRIAGVCLDPINNGNVTYVPLRVLQGLANVSRPNLIMARINDQANQGEVLGKIRSRLSIAAPDFEISELNVMLERSLNLVGFAWDTIMFLPLLSLIGATLCLTGYVALTIDEQRQEFGVLRAVGARPRMVVKILGAQILLVLLASWVTGIMLGIMITLLILVPEPLVTSYTIGEIALRLLVVFTVIFAFSLFPALRFSRKPILAMTA